MAAAGKIFISYRRADSIKDALAVYERLCREFGKRHVFIDLEGIAPGADFVEVLERNLDGCEVLVALIGPDWASARNGQGALRLHDPDDFVRIEVGTALGRGIKVFPVLLDGAPPLRADQLPAELQALVRRQAVKLDIQHFDADMQRLVQAIENETGLRPRRWLPPALAALFVVGGAALWVLSGNGGARTEVSPEVRTAPPAEPVAPSVNASPAPAPAAPTTASPAQPPAQPPAATGVGDLLRRLKAANVLNSVGDTQMADWLDDPDRHYLRLAEACLRLIGTAHLSADGADLDKINAFYSAAIGLQGDALMPPQHQVDAARLSRAIVDAYNDKNGGTATALSQLLQ